MGGAGKGKKGKGKRESTGDDREVELLVIV